MGELILFRVPEGYKSTTAAFTQRERGRVIEFRRAESHEYTQPTWIFPEVDADLA